MHVTRVTGFAPQDEPEASYTYIVRGRRNTTYTMPYLGYRVEVELSPRQAQVWEQSIGSAKRALFEQHAPEIESYASSTFVFLLRSSKISNPREAAEVILQQVTAAFLKASFFVNP